MLIRSFRLALLLAVASSQLAAQARQYDIVIRGGRVMDPESGFDAIANVGIRGARIDTITRQPIDGRRIIDARGRTVAPGFIDILGEGYTPEANRFKVMDGVTTVLGMHGGPLRIGEWYDSLEAAGQIINFGATTDHRELREAVGLTDRNAAATPAQLARMLELGRRAIQEGGIGFGFGVQYVPGSSEAEILELFRLAAHMGVPVHLHTRFLGAKPPENSIKGIQEVIADAAATGVSAQIAHINSVAGHSMDVALSLIAGARERGIDVMADAYPWEAGSTMLESAVFDPGWQERMGITYHDIELTKTGERLTAETFKMYREDSVGHSVVAHFVPKAGNVKALTSPHVMVGSDGAIYGGRGHPRGAGTFAKFLREYVREEKHLSLMEALRKLTIMPAGRVVAAAPVMRRKGRLSPGADADVVVFDLNRVRERATYQQPAQYSEGFDYVLVNGVVMVADGQLTGETRGGVPVRGAAR